MKWLKYITLQWSHLTVSFHLRYTVIIKYSLCHICLEVSALLYAREWTENGQLWVQQVSSTPATRLDVVNLQEELDRRLQQRQARETGICPVRRELYSQCFGMLTTEYSMLTFLCCIVMAVYICSPSCTYTYTHMHAFIQICMLNTYITLQN